jgi:hypothetical protein
MAIQWLFKIAVADLPLGGRFLALSASVKFFAFVCHSIAAAG